jgi:hypothetical protein
VTAAIPTTCSVRMRRVADQPEVAALTTAIASATQTVRGCGCAASLTGQRSPR